MVANVQNNDPTTYFRNRNGIRFLSGVLISFGLISAIVGLLISSFDSIHIYWSLPYPFPDHMVGRKYHILTFGIIWVAISIVPVVVGLYFCCCMKKETDVPEIKRTEINSFVSPNTSIQVPSPQELKVSFDIKSIQN